jgi:ABC-type lipoprotein export system ATPase subunit
MVRELWAQGVGVDVGSRVILDKVDLKVAAGETVVITGPSGSGKTTLLLVMAGLQEPDRGQVLLDGQPLSSGDAVRRRFGIVLQNHGLVSVLTAAENVALPLQARGLAPAEVAERTREALVAVGLAEKRALVLGLLRAHGDKGNIVVLASHDQKVADAADRALALVDGRPRGT